MRELCREKVASKLDKSRSKMVSLRARFPEQIRDRKWAFLLATITIKPYRKMTSVKIIIGQKSACP